MCSRRSIEWTPARRRRVLIWSGSAATAGFVALRLVNGYGNPAPWSALSTPALTLAAFLNVNKYPPSLLFLLMTLGPILVGLAYAEGLRGRLAGWLSVYGRVPLFYYIGHIYVAHAVAILLGLVQSGELRRFPVVSDPASIPPRFGVPLWGVYLCWIAVVLLMYAPCRWFARFKRGTYRLVAEHMPDGPSRAFGPVCCIPSWS